MILIVLSCQDKNKDKKKKDDKKDSNADEKDDQPKDIVVELKNTITSDKGVIINDPTAASSGEEFIIMQPKGRPNDEAEEVILCYDSYFKALACDHFRRMKKNAYTIVKSNAVNALDDAE